MSKTIPLDHLRGQKFGRTYDAPELRNGFSEAVAVNLPSEYSRVWSLVFEAPVNADGGDPTVSKEEVGGVILNPGAPTAALNFPGTNAARVRLRYGDSAAQSMAVTFDYPARGAVIEVSGSFIEVSLNDTGAAPGVVPPAVANPARYQVGCWDAGGAPRPRPFTPAAFDSQQTLTIGLTDAGNFPAGAASYLSIPRRTWGFRAHGIAVGGGVATAYTAIQYDGQGNLLARTSTSFLGVVPVVAGAQQVRIENTSGVAYERFYLAFLLSF